MRRNKNEELEPWELPDRPLNPKEEEKPSSAGSQWVNRPANSQPAPKTAQKAYEVPPPNTRQAGRPVDFLPISNVDHVMLEDLLGYEKQKQELRKRKAHNIRKKIRQWKS